MKSGSRADKVLAVVCAAFLGVMCLTIGIRFFTRNVLIEILHKDNAFTRLVWYDNETMWEMNTDGSTTAEEIDWEALYPFEKEEEIPGTSERTDRLGLIGNRINDIADFLKTTLDNYCSDHLLFYHTFAETSKQYEKTVGWNIVPFHEYNGVLRYGGNYFYRAIERRDVSEAAASTVKLAEYCREKGIRFVFYALPVEISKYEDAEISGVSVFANENMDEFLNLISEKGVCFCDMREEIQADGLKHHELFFGTDHHWKPETGLWAAGKLLNWLDGMDITADVSVADPEDYDYVVYKNIFLGSEGKKVGLRVAKPEDITLIYPMTETRFTFEIPSRGVDLEGDLSIMYDMRNVEKIDYYNMNPYAVYLYADNALTRIGNELCDNDTSVLIVHDSFCDCVIPFLAMGVKHVDSVDLRYFTGSLRALINEGDYDAVIVANNPSTLSNPDYSVHTGCFDFR